MLGWAVYALLGGGWPPGGWRRCGRCPAAEGPPQGLIRMAAVWVRAAGILAVLLGLKAAFWPMPGLPRGTVGGRGHRRGQRRRGHHGRLAAPRGLGLLGRPGGQSGRLAGRLALPVLALRWRSGGCDWSRPMSSPARRWPWPGWRPGDASISSATSPSARARCWPSRSRCRRPAAWCCWRCRSAGWFAVRRGCPLGPPAWPRRPGWIGLLSAAAAAGWYLRHTLSGHVLHVLGCLLLGVGVLAACHAGQSDSGGYPGSATTS